MIAKFYKGREVYGREHWKGDFNRDFKPGDLVNSDIVWEMANCVPPHFFSRVLIQCGEPFDHREDEKGKFRPTYTTFENVAGGLDESSVWVYRGHCFGGETEERGRKMQYVV